MNAADVVIEPDTAEDNLPGEVEVPPSRSSADVVGELEAKRSRGVELTARLEQVTAELEELRQARARLLVDGKPDGPVAKRIAALTEEVAGLEAALGLLADDQSKLQAEHAGAELHEAREAEGEAMEAARDALDVVEAGVREAARQILPLGDSFDQSMRVARGAENEANRLARRADPSLSDMQPERLARVARRRTALLELVEHVRRWARDNAGNG
jgi:hypothetical protein